jgi:hypothetical protein
MITRGIRWWNSGILDNDEIPDELRGRSTDEEQAGGVEDGSPPLPEKVPVRGLWDIDD